MALTQEATLRSIAIFRDLGPERAKALAAQCQWLKFSRARQILGQQDSTTDVFLVVQGTLQAIGYSGAGKAVSFAEIGPGEVFGEFSAIDGRPRSASVTARTACLVGRLNSAAFRDTLANEPNVALRLLERLVVKTRLLSERVFEFSTLSVQSRLHAELLRMAGLTDGRGQSAKIDPAPTHHEIATRISTQREAVTRELNRLAEDGVIGIGRRRIEVRDGDRLRAMLDRARLA